ncbi:MAG TPA: FUSC family protein, partial [bacterium]|nr:FUSC family protein [bacterium]
MTGVPPPAPADVDSWAVRLAYTARVAVAAGVTTALWQAFAVTHGIWLTVSAIVVIQPRRGQAWAKGASRTIGTVIGAAVATVCAAVMPANALTVGLAVAVTILICWGSGRLQDPM